MTPSAASLEAGVSFSFISASFAYAYSIATSLSVAKMRMWQEITVGFLGIWLVVLAVLGVANPLVMLATGVLVGLLGFWSVVRERRTDHYVYRRDFGLFT